LDTLTQLKQIISHQKLVAFELERSVTYTEPSGAQALILQAINALHRRGSGHMRLHLLPAYSKTVKQTWPNFVFHMK